MKITDLTVEQFRFLVEDIIEEKLEQYFGDPDAGLELRPEIVKELTKSLAETKRGKRGIPMEQVCKEFGIKLEE
jgi:hypothetical protein